jgi:hypothetical protein
MGKENILYLENTWLWLQPEDSCSKFSWEKYLERSLAFKITGAELIPIFFP